MERGVEASRTKAALVFLVCAAVSFLLVLLAAGPAEASEDETVRVGWFQSDMFQEGMADDQEKSGYCYDYLQKVSDYTSWNYEYVYGEWADLLEMLQTGKIDLLAGVSPTEERKKTIAFPDSAMGTDQYYVYKKADDASIDSSDLSTLNGKKAGGVKENRATLFTQQWIEENKLDVEVKLYDGFEELEEAFNQGEVDVMTQTINNVLSLPGVTIISKVGEEPFYLAVTKGKTEILGQLNSALTTMLSVDPFILENLQYANYGATLTSRTLTVEETDWIKEHPVITVGYLDNYLPFSDADSDLRASGLMTDVMDAIIRSLGLEGSISASYVPFSSGGEMLAALKEGKVDAIFPVYGDLWLLEKDGVDATSSVVTPGEVFVYKGTYQKDQVKTVAVSASNDMQAAFTQKVFPDAALMECSSIEACLQAVMDGRADGTVLNTLRTGIVTEGSRYRSLSFVQLEDEVSRCFGVRGDETELLLLLNRGIKIVGTSFALSSSYKYMSGLSSYSAADFLADNWLVFALLALVVVAVIIGLLLKLLRRRKKEIEEKAAHVNEMTALNRELEEHQAQLEEAAAEREAQVEEVTALNSELEEARAEADAANDAKTNFLFSMSHDIRTPMNAIIGFTGLLRSHQDEPERRESYIDKIEDSSHVLLSIINNVLDMARIESGAVTVDEKPASVQAFKAAMIAVFGDMMAEKGLTFNVEANTTHDLVIIDETKTLQIMNNLVSNACKYTEPGGRVDVIVDEVPSEVEGHVNLRAVVADTGIGMDAAYLPHLFEEFSRERTSTEAKVEGTGLGMPIVKRLVDLVGGTIEVESQKGVGTTYTLLLPCRVADVAEKTEEEHVLVDLETLRGKRILIAEDNDLNAEIAQEILVEAGFVVERAEDGAVCVEMLTAAPVGYYDVVLMDVQMPNMNGYEATQAIRAMGDPAKAGIPILAMTANAFAEDKQMAIQSGMNGHLAKPVDVDELMSALASALGRN